MRRIVYKTEGQYSLEDCDSTYLQDGEVRLIPQAILVLPSDTVQKNAGRVPGVCFSAQVAESASPDYFPEDWVASISAAPCRACPSCKEGRFAACEAPLRLGIDLDGGWAEEAVVPAQLVYPLGEEPDPVQAAFLLPLAQAVRAFFTCGLRPGASVGIVGAGLYGMLALQAAKALGARTVCVLDAAESRRRKAVRLGADLALNPADGQVLRRLRNQIEGGLEFVLETGENAGSEELTLACLVPGGTAGLLFPSGRAISLSQSSVLHAASRGVSCVFCDALGAVPIPAEALRTAWRLLSSGKIGVQELIDRRVALTALPGALEDAAMGLVRGALVAQPESALFGETPSSKGTI